MSTRWQPNRPDRRRPEKQDMKKYLLPAAGVAAVLLMVGLLVVLMASENADDQDDDSVIADADTTPTAEAETPVATMEVDEDVTPTPEMTEVGEGLTPTPVSTPDEETEPTPAPEPTPEPEPTPVPIVGDFGELPPGDMPSGSPAEAMSLQFHLDMSLQNVPAEAAVYQVERRQWTMDDVQALANRLGVDGEVVDQGENSFRVEGSESSVYISSSMIQYVRPSTAEGPPELPDNEQLGQMARSWLTDNGLVSADVGPTQVLDRDTESGLAYVQVKPVEPSNIISATPSAGVTVRGDGMVTEAMINWPQSLSGSTYGLRPADELWASASQGRGFVDINVNDLPPNFQGAGGTVTITGASIAYTMAGNPQGSQFLVPVVVFSGSAVIDGADGNVPVSIYVEAVSAQASPRG